VLNAANEIAVETFLNGRIPFLAIEDLIEEVLGKHNKIDNPDLEQIFESDKWTREITEEVIRNKGW